MQSYDIYVIALAWVMIMHANKLDCSSLGIDKTFLVSHHCWNQRDLFSITFTKGKNLHLTIPEHYSHLSTTGQNAICYVSEQKLPRIFLTPNLNPHSSHWLG